MTPYFSQMTALRLYYKHLSSAPLCFEVGMLTFWKPNIRFSEGGRSCRNRRGKGSTEDWGLPSLRLWVSCVFAISHWILDFLDSMILGRNKALLSIKDNFWQCNESLCVLSKCSVFYNIIIYLPYYTSSKQQDRNHTTYSRILISSLTPVPVSTQPL